MSSKCQLVKPAATALMVAALGATAFGADSVQFQPGSDLAQQWNNMPRRAITNFTVTETPQARVDDPSDPTKRSVEWWNNGDRDNNVALRSQTDDWESFRVADDFFLQEGCWYHIHEVTVVMCVSVEAEIRNYGLEFYTDCNGVPDQLILGPYLEFTEEQIGLVDDEGLVLYQVTFKVGEFLPGYQRLWLSPYGIGNIGEYFWVSSNDLHVQGRKAHERYMDFDWTPVDADCAFCEVFCTDFFFTIEGQVCKVLKDNSDYVTSAGPAVAGIPNLAQSLIPFKTAAADDFQVPPGKDQEICKLKVWVASNCIEFIRGGLFENECDAPTGDVIELGAPFSIELLEGEAHLGLPVYLVTWVNNENHPVLEAARNYWLAISFPGATNQNHRAYWLYKAPNSCTTLNINEAHYRRANSAFMEFTPYSLIPVVGFATDHAFKLWTNPVPHVCDDDDDDTSGQNPITPGGKIIGDAVFGAGQSGSQNQTFSQFAR